MSSSPVRRVSAIDRRRLRTVAVALIAIAAAAGFVSVGGARTNAAPVNTALPTISGTAQDGQTLTTTTGTWSGGVTSYVYGWLRCDSGGGSCTQIPNRNRSTYPVQSGDVGHTLESVVTAKNSDGSTDATSAHTAVVTAAAKPVNTAVPTISGNTTVGSTLTSTTGTWTSNGATNYTYSWERCDSNGNNCAAISGATSQTYVLVTADVGHKLRVVVTATNSGGSTAATSAVTATITGAASTAPSLTTAPTISGTPKQGQTLTVSTGTWSGTAPITYTYAWQRSDANGANVAVISGATSQSYVLTTADVGKYIRVRVTATNSAGSGTTLSNTVGPVASGLPPGAVKLPNGDISIPAANVPDTDRLLVASVSFSPSVMHPHQSVVATFKIIDSTTNYVVAGALVYVLPIPYNWAKSSEMATATDGTVSISITPTSALPKTGALVLFVRARTPQGNKLAGSSVRRLVQVRIRP